MKTYNFPSQLIEWDTKEFSEALDLYARLAKKSFYECLQKKGADVFFKAAKHVPRAAVKRIRAKYTPRYIAAILRKKHGGERHEVRGRTVSRRGRVYWPHYVRQWSAEDARKLYRALYKRAGRSVGFIRAFLTTMAKNIKGNGTVGYVGGISGTGKAQGPGEGRAQGVETTVKVYVTENGLDLLAEGIYRYRRRRPQVKIAEDIMESAIARGVEDVKADMAQYIERKLEEAGIRISAT